VSRLDAIAIASAPMRVSLAGGGTDLPSYAERFGGTVVSLAIDRRVVVGACPRAVGNLIERLGDGSRIGHEELMRDEFVSAAMSRVGTEVAELACVSAAPPRSGLGGSGAFLVALVHALRATCPPSPNVLAEEASTIEMSDLGRTVGKQDHYVAALGGLQTLRIGSGGVVSAEAVGVSDAFATYVADRLLLFHTGLSHDAGEILAAQDRQTRRSEASTLDRLNAIHALAGPMLDAIRQERLDEIGPILDQHWRYKARLSDAVAIPRAADLYELALKAGADGGKLLGAGGGGFMLLSCRPGRQQELRASMAFAGATELRFALSRVGSTLRREPLGGEVLEVAGVAERRAS
jgi:D-glycero-alpha-D-manno-heptose-7-phosphate kinase